MTYLSTFKALRRRLIALLGLSAAGALNHL
jgi:hypothetical protein